jgi:hypothetical protein
MSTLRTLAVSLSVFFCLIPTLWAAGAIDSAEVPISSLISGGGDVNRVLIKRFVSATDPTCYFDVTRLGSLMSIQYKNGEIFTLTTGANGRLESMTVNGNTKRLVYSEGLPRTAKILGVEDADGGFRPIDVVRKSLQRQPLQSSEVPPNEGTQALGEESPKVAVLANAQAHKSRFLAKMQRKMCGSPGLAPANFIKTDAEPEEFAYMLESSFWDAELEQFYSFGRKCGQTEGDCRQDCDDMKDYVDIACFLFGGGVGLFTLRMSPAQAIIIGTLAGGMCLTGNAYMRSVCREDCKIPPMNCSPL